MAHGSMAYNHMACPWTGRECVQHATYMQLYLFAVNDVTFDMTGHMPVRFEYSSSSSASRFEFQQAGDAVGLALL